MTSEIETIAGTPAVIPIITDTVNISPEKRAIIEKIQSRGNNIAVINGVFGDMEGCDGVVEERIEPAQGGLFVKIMGCPYLFKGFPDKRIVEGLAIGKSLISLLPRLIIASSYFWRISFLIRYLFSPTYFWHDMHIFAWNLYQNVATKSELPRKLYNKPTNVLREAVDTALSQCLDYEYSNQYKIDPRHGDIHVVNKVREIWETITCFFEFIYLFLEQDNAYRFRLQDVIPLVKKENIKKDVVKEVSRLFDILIEREHPMYGIAHKWKRLKNIIIPLLWFDKRMAKFTRLFFLAIDTKEFALDEADRYFCLRRRSHNIDGTILSDRLKEKERIDKEKGIVLMQLLQIIKTNGEKGFAIKFL